MFMLLCIIERAGVFHDPTVRAFGKCLDKTIIGTSSLDRASRAPLMMHTHMWLSSSDVSLMSSSLSHECRWRLASTSWLQAV